MDDRKFVIRGISGWQKYPQCEATSAKGVRCLKGEGHDRHAFPQPRLSPAEALEKIKAAAAEGNVVLATDLEPERGGFSVTWACEGSGFGELTVWMNKDGTIEIDDECMSKDTLKAILVAIVDQGVTLSEKQEKV